MEIVALFIFAVVLGIFWGAMPKSEMEEAEHYDEF